MQFGLIGLTVACWVYSLIAIILVGILDYRPVDLSARVMVVLVGLEYLIVPIVDFAILGAGGADDTGLAVNIFYSSSFTPGSLTAAILLCLGSFIGIEATRILRAISGLIMAALFVYIFFKNDDLTGTAGGSLSWIPAALIPAGGVVGVVLAQRLKSSDPWRFARMGMNLPD